MIGKLVTHAPTRIEAINKMKTALDAFVVKGVRCNINFVRDVMDNPRFMVLGESKYFSLTHLSLNYSRAISQLILLLKNILPLVSEGEFACAVILERITDNLCCQACVDGAGRKRTERHRCDASHAAQAAGECSLI